MAEEEEHADFIGMATGSGTLRYDADLPEPVVTGKLGRFRAFHNHMMM